ncbi:hypothetical protein Pmani_036441 [Petrolisthes manimaculis]|uniref:Uncharacterized protein n=1 Tax=Petrolisthes manimaculis TaxID=1843537 RepID=A0AAE1NIG4_9EUCA|nr:hypothetical protein Pmani_036441 [Petrolisthes manimaculis]
MDEVPVNRTEIGGLFDHRPVTAAGSIDRPGTRGSVGGAARPSSRPAGATDRTEMRQMSSYGDRPSTRQAITPQADGSSRPTTSGRPVTARPVSAALRNAPGTASRLLSTASLQRPGTRTGVATGIGFNTPINVVDRPITQQGLSGMKTSSRGPQRQVQDKSYFLGLLRTKMSEVVNEVGRLTTEMESMKQEQSTFLTYDKRVKEMAQELTELQGTLADYNLMVDLLNTDTEKGEVDAETREVAEENKQDEQELDALFSRKQHLQATAVQLETEIQEERHMGESMVAGMEPNLRQRYVELQSQNTSLLQHLDHNQHEIDTIDTRVATLEDELATSKVKQEAVGLYERLQELEEKRTEIQAENHKRGTPKEERERLLLQVKEDNAEIATMDRQVSEVQEQMRQLTDELHQLDQELEENQSERSQKYRELRKREETIDQFLAGFEVTQAEELSRLDIMEENNVDILEKLSTHLAHFKHLPSTNEFDVMRSDLAFKEGELEKSKFTEQGLKNQNLNLQSNLQKIEALESKVQKELVELKERLATMDEEMVEFSDVAGLRARAEDRRRQLAADREQLEARMVAASLNIKEGKAAVASLKSQLQENETHAQLAALEKKWAHLEQTNFTLREVVAQRKAESNYLPTKVVTRASRKLNQAKNYKPARSSSD